jgi:hypothetical protein
MMKNSREILAFMLLLCASYCLGQPSPSSETIPDKGIVIVYPSPDGNYIRVFPKDLNLTAFNQTMSKTAYFKVVRSTQSFGNIIPPTEVGKIERLKKAKDLAKALGPELMKDFRQVARTKTDQEVENFLKTEFNYDSLGIYLETNIKFLAILGHGLLDKTALKDSIYLYEVTRIDQDGSQEYWGKGMIHSKMTNPELLKIKPEVLAISSTDSLVNIDWKVNFKDYAPKREALVLDSIPENVLLEEYSKLKRKLSNKIGVVLNSKSQGQFNTKFNIYYKRNNEIEWHFHDKILSYRDSTGMFRITANIRCFPEDLITAMAIPEDYANALGDTSEIANAYAISAATVPLIYNVSGADSINCIKIRWQKLPIKPYYTGVTIARSYDETDREVIAVVNYQDTEYADYQVVPGKNYTYHVSPAFLPKQTIKQAIPANINLASTKFSNPLPPFNLEVDPLSKQYPILKWQSADDRTSYCYYVYRGLSPTKMILASTVIKGKTYTDSTNTLSGRSTYYYAVIQQNLTQDTSDFSNRVSFSPQKVEEFWAPANLNHSLINNDLILEWPDARANDDFVAGYVLQRKRGKGGVFKSVSAYGLDVTQYVDTTFVIGEDFFYRIASVSLKGDTSAFTAPITVNYPKAGVKTLKQFELINSSKGILIKWPSIEHADVASYKIFRQKENEETLTLLGSVARGNFQFLDTNIKEDVSYAYSVVVVEKDGRESLTTNLKSINRTKPMEAK